MYHSDNEILNSLRRGDQQALKHLFDLFYKDLVIHGMKFVSNQQVVEEIVQDLFIRIWQIRDDLKIRGSLRIYLFTAVKNRSISYLRSRYARIRFTSLEESPRERTTHTAEDRIIAGELKAQIQDAIRKLPPKCRIIFRLSRNLGLSGKEIAEYLQISPKTVQVQLTIAMRKIRDHLERHRKDPVA